MAGLTVVVIGFDPGWTKLAYSIVDIDKKVRYYSCVEMEAKPVEYIDAIRWQRDRLLYREQILQFGNGLKITVPGLTTAFIEEPLFVNNAKTTVKLSLIAGMIAGSLCQAQVENVYVVNNATWKKEVIGNGHAKKEQIKEVIQEKTGLPDFKKPQWDIYDATGIALYGVMKLRGEVE